MKTTDAELGRAIMAAIRLRTAAAAEVDLLPRIENRLRSRRASCVSRRLGKRGLSLAIAVGLLGATTLAVSASGATRSFIGGVVHQAATVVGIRSDSSGAPTTLSPKPGFQVLEPAYVPSELGVRQTTYYPGRRTGSGAPWSGTLTQGSGAAPPDPARLRTITSSGAPTLYNRFYSSSGSGFVEVIEQRAATPGGIPAGERVAVGSRTGYLEELTGQTTLTLTESGTRVQIVTNLGRVEAIKVAASLR